LLDLAITLLPFKHPITDAAFIKIARVPSFASTQRYLLLQVTTWEIREILERSPAREKMAARRELRKWLQARGHDMSRFDALAKSEGAA
jgi:hypothetical protein